MNGYPYVAWESDGAEVIACGPKRYRLIVRDQYVGKFTNAISAVVYYNAEFNLSFPKA